MRTFSPLPNRIKWSNLVHTSHCSNFDGENSGWGKSGDGSILVWTTSWDSHPLPFPTLLNLILYQIASDVSIAVDALYKPPLDCHRPERHF